MPQIINTNIMSLNSQRNLNRSQDSMATALQRLSSGLRINSAKDDAAGLAISERFTTQIRGLNQAIRNANDGISFAQTAEGALGTVGDALQRIRELAVQSANDTNSSTDRQALQNEVSQLVSEVNRVANSTEFNGQKILDGSLDDLVFQVGANRNQTISVDGVDSRTSQLGAAVFEGTTIDVSETAASTSDADGFPAFAAGDLTDVSVNGVTVDLSEATSLDDVVSAINSEYGSTGVQAVRATTVDTGSLTYTAPTGGTSTITLNGVNIVISDGATITDAIDAINARSSQTNVTATVDTAGTGFTLSSSSDIFWTVTDSAGAAAGTGMEFAYDDGDGAGTTLASGNQEIFSRGIELTAEVGEDITVAGTDYTDLGLQNDLGGTALDEVDYAVSALDITSRDGANDAMRTVDLALQQVNSLRSELGSVQTRFESTISNLQIASENLSAARSRIRDADFAAETAELTRAQILQQAGTAMLAQANQLPQNVLTLLQ
jgi:flagellin